MGLLPINYECMTDLMSSNQANENLTKQYADAKKKVYGILYLAQPSVI